MSKVLEVKKLKISFRTNNGTVKAVRDISFDLHQGETLAIVGESGSGKSVTSKAILGILAGNSIIDGGEILYDGKDLLKIPESEMHKLRGDKIAMVFQDPLSSLDPIVKIGKQITEAMLLKNKAARKVGKIEFNSMLKTLKNNMNEATNNENVAEIDNLIKTFDEFNIKALELENDYNESYIKVEELIGLINDFLFLAEKNQSFDVVDKIKDLAKLLARVNNHYLIYAHAKELESFKLKLAELVKINKQKKTLKEEYQKHFKGYVAAYKVAPGTVEVLEQFKELLVSLTQLSKPNFFRIGYYMYKNPTADLLTGKTVDEVNEKTLEFLENDFMRNFIVFEKKAVTLAFNRSLELKKQVLVKLAEAKSFFSTIELNEKECNAYAEELAKLVESSFNLLDPSKDSIAYTFETSLKYAIKSFFAARLNNEKEEVRFTKQTAKREALIAKGKKADWKVIPKKIISLQDQLEGILSVLARLEEKYALDIQNATTVDFDAKAVELVDFFKEKASQVVYKLTKGMAKEQAIKLLDEVCIPESRLRYNQYPFELSGGMRQRIVIAIALSSNPNILICDEPTTALDVTIQAQILDLIKELKKEYGFTVIFITHDLGVVANMADRIAVMYAGKIVEYGTSEDVFYQPAHPYTWALLSSMPDLDTAEKLEAIPGTPPNMIYPPEGDAFAERNKYALKVDFEKQPPLFKISETHYAATWLLHPNAPKVELPKIVAQRIQHMKEAGENNGRK